jgi:beta-lactamase superfamily II metal-dependent hydrolase
MRRAIVGVLALFVFSSASAGPPPEPRKPLQIYFVDVEGGQATLFVSPSGQSLLIDTGWSDFDNRDANRIVAAAKDAKLDKIDFVLLTHYHIDHAGGVPQLVAKIPIGEFLDHGQNSELGHTDIDTEKVFQEYLKVAAEKNIKRTTLKPGDALPLPGVGTKVITSDGVLIDHPLPSAGTENAACKTAEPFPVDQTENPRSLGTLFTFGKLRILDLGDLTSDKEMGLMCPVNKLGTVDIYIVNHHGSATSNSALFLNGIAPRVAIMDNGATKGAAPSSWEAVKNSPRLQDLWQLHYSNADGASHNVAEPLIANLPGPDAGNYLKLTAWPGGSFDIFNSRTQTTRHYPASD